MQCCSEKEKQGGCCKEEGSCRGECGSCDMPSSCDDSTESNGLDVGKFFLLTVISGGMYLIYWFYRNWKHIKEHTKSSIRPACRTVAAFFPVLDIIFFCLQLKTIHELARKQGSRAFPLVWTCVGIALVFIASWALLAATSITYGAEQFGLSLVGFLLSIFVALILMPVQLALNDFWKHAQPAASHIRASYTNGEKAWLVIGSLIMFFNLLIAFIMPSPFDPFQNGGYEGDYRLEDSLDLETPEEPE